MPQLSQSLHLQTGQGKSYRFSLSENYNEVFNLRQEVDNSDAFITLVQTSTTLGSSKLRDVKCMVIKNEGRCAIEVQFKITEYKNNSNVDDANSVDMGGGATTTRYLSFLLAAREYIFLPNARWVGYNADTSAGNAKPTTNGDYLSLASSLEVDSGTQINQADFEDSSTTLTVDDGDLFRVGDLIQLGINDTTATRIEVMRVTNIATHVLTVERALHGTSAADRDSQTDATSGAVDNAKVYFPIFNAYADYDKYSVIQTDTDGKFKCLNFFGYGRVADGTSGGIVPGSVAGKFYEPGYQELGMTGITGTTNSGLTAGGTYKIDITVDGGTKTQDVTFTLDSSNTNFGGNTGVVRKIQDALDALYYDQSSNMYEKRVIVSIVNGDLRFTSGQSLSTSAILLEDTGDSGSFLDASAQGRIPAAGSIRGAVAARLPNDTMINKEGVTVPNIGAFFYDDGHGFIKGTASGTINYETGSIDFRGLPNAEFVITANYDSAHGGGNNTGSAVENMIIEISARCCNSKLNAPIEIVAFN